MLLYELDIKDIEITHIQALIENEIYESKHIEYKRDLGNLKENRTEFLNDLTSMANSDGGDIIYGIQEENGKPYSIVGIDEQNLDERVLQIANIIRDSVSPRLKYDLKFITMQENQYVLIIRVPKSYNMPHMVISKSGQGFYIRNLNGKQKMDISEIRECFLTSAGYSKEAYLFHLKDELEFNIKMLRNLATYLVDNPPIENAFEPINIGSKHFRIEAWNSLVRAGILPLLPNEQQTIFQDADKSIREIVRLIQIENAEWKRILEFNRFYKGNKTVQLTPLQEPYGQIRRHLRNEIEKTLNCIDLALSAFNKS